MVLAPIFLNPKSLFFHESNFVENADFIERGDAYEIITFCDQADPLIPVSRI